jgi:hypothetical protein
VSAAAVSQAAAPVVEPDASSGPAGRSAEALEHRHAVDRTTRRPVEEARRGCDGGQDEMEEMTVELRGWRKMNRPSQWSRGSEEDESPLLAT